MSIAEKYVILSIVGVFMKPYAYSLEKTLQALYYIQSKSNITDKKSLLKLLFFSDRYHIRNYGLPILDDDYFAMKKGPVCSHTYDLLKAGKYYNNLSESERNFVDKYITRNENIIYINEIDFDNLSDSEKIALDFSVTNFSKFTSKELSDISHIYPEWKMYEDRFKTAHGRFKMDYKFFFSNPDVNDEKLLKYLNGKDPFEDDADFTNAMKEEYIEYANSI